jgi:lysophospholipase L1-like esterase
MRSARLAAAAATTCALLLGACSSGGTADVERQVEDVTDASPPSIGTYVALGDSFTAGPLIPATDLADGCFRSDGNYPSLVAERLDVDELVDVSCSGAKTTDLVKPQRPVEQATVPPQLEAVTPDADLVTLGIGGNDFSLFTTLVATCSQLRSNDPDGSPCADELEDRGIDLVARTDEISTRVERSVRRFQRRAPSAEVMVVGYLRLAPEKGGCQELPFAQGDYAFGQRLTAALNGALERAARRTGTTFVDAYELSAGHDVCSEDPWVNGRVTKQGEALAFHPYAEGMAAVAEEIVTLLD